MPNNPFYAIESSRFSPLSTTDPSTARAAREVDVLADTQTQAERCICAAGCVVLLLWLLQTDGMKKRTDQLQSLPFLIVPMEMADDILNSPIWVRFRALENFAFQFILNFRTLPCQLRLER